MSKRLPYFQFEPAEWLAGDIMFCTLQAQGLFTTLKALYWQKDCDLMLEQALKRLKNEDLFEELISEKIIKIKTGKIRINFLDEQWDKLSEKSKINSKNGSLGGRPKKQTETENKPNGFDSVSKNESETKALRREEIREENNNKKKEEFNARKLKFSSTLEPYLKNYGRVFLNDFNKYWIEPNKSQTKFRQELEKTWDLERRLETWAKNEKNFKKNEQYINSRKPSANSGYKPATVDREKLIQELTDDVANGNIPGVYQATAS